MRRGRKNRRITIRVDETTYQIISDLAELSGSSKSEVIRYAIVFARVLHDPDLRLRDALKDQYVSMVLRDPEPVLELPVIDVIKPLRQLMRVVGVEG